MTIKAQISEADVTRVKPGLPVCFTILGEPDERYHATLRAVEPAPDSIQKDETTASLTSASGSARPARRSTTTACSTCPIPTSGCGSP